MAQQPSGLSLQQRIAGIFSSTRQEELLPPKQAFQVKAALKGQTTIVAELMPAKGYSLYRDRIRFLLKDAKSVAIKAVKLPAGKVMNDPDFGRMETYENPLQAEITLERAPGSENFTLVAIYQGCHRKTRVCYPLAETALNFSLPQGFCLSEGLLAFGGAAPLEQLQTHRARPVLVTSDCLYGGQTFQFWKRQ